MAIDKEFLYLGKNHTIEEILKLNDYRFTRDTLVRRLSKGQSADEAVSAILTFKERQKPLVVGNRQMSRIKFAAEHNITSSMLSIAPYKNMNPLEAVEKIKEKMPTKYPYQTDSGEIKYFTMMEAAKEFHIDYTTIRRYILSGLSMNVAVDTARSNQLEILSVPPLTEYEFNNTDEGAFNTIQDRLKKYCVAKRISYRFIYYLVKEKGFTIKQAITMYKDTGRSGPNKWVYLVNDILLNSFCIKYMLDDKQMLVYLKALDNDLVAALERSVFLNIFYDDFDITPSVRKDLLDIYLEMMNLAEDSRLNFLHSALNFSDENGKTILERVYSYLLKKYGFITILQYYYQKNEEAEILADNILEFIEMSVVDFFTEKYNKISIIKRDVELLRIKALYQRESDKEQILVDYNLSRADLDYMYSPDGLYAGYNLIDDRRVAEEVQLNDSSEHTLTYQNRWYF